MGKPAPFNLDSLSQYLRAQLPDMQGELKLEQISGGHSNPTFFLTVGDNPRIVLRKQPPGKLLPSAHAIDREFRVISGLAKTPVPVPNALHYCTDASIIGTPFYLMECLDGRIFHDNSLPGLTSEKRTNIFNTMCDTLADLHSVDVDAVGLRDFGKTGGFVERQISRWSKQYKQGKFRTVTEIERLALWLSNNLPNDDEQTTIVHGDYRLGNLVLHPDKSTIIGILDWELSTLGHPMTDLGYNLMAWSMHSSEYNGISDCDLPVLGIPATQDYIARYFKQRGLSHSFNPFYIALAFFRLAVIFEGIVGRAKQGNQVDEKSTNLDNYPQIFATHGLRITGM